MHFCWGSARLCPRQRVRITVAIDDGVSCAIHACSQLLAGLEHRRVPGRDRHRFTGSRIPSLPFALSAHLKTTETAQVNLVAPFKRVADGTKHTLNRVFGLCLGALRLLRDLIDE